jgi:DNA polymerase type I
MANEKAKSDYKHWVCAVPKIENWYKNFNFVLVESMEDLESIFKDKKDYYMAFDTETTGLDFEEIDLVGYSFCLDGKTAYYVPVYHFQYGGNLGEESVKFIYERMCEAKKVFMYNMRYDARIMEYYGYKENKADLDKRRWMYAKFDMSKVDYYDVSVPVWLADTNQKYPSLKWSSLHFLGIEQLHFDEVIENAGSFFYLNPSENQDTVFYAAADALCTFLLATATVKYFTEAKHSAKFDNLMLYPLLHYENERIWLDGDVLKNLYITATDRVDKMERDVYAMIGGQINLNSPVQVAQAFERLGIDTGERTSKGTMSVGIKILADLPKEYVEKFPALKSYINYKKTAKLISSYIKPLLKEYERRGYCRFAYKTTEVPTGRLASGKDGKNSFFSPINAQCVVGSSELFTDRGVKTIKDISVGDNVWDGESFREVLNTYNNGIQDVYKVTLCDGKTLICTDKHQLYSSVVFSAFRELKDLNVGDSVAININSVDIGFSSNSLNTRNSLDFDNVVGWVKIKSIEYVGKEEVYDIHVDVTHRYCVNGFITHNSLPKPHVKMEDVFDLGDRNLFSKKDNIIMGYKFVYSSYDEDGKHIIPDDPTYIGWVEGMDDDLNIRMAISPKMLEDSGDDEFLYTSFDYAAEELRIAANLSREPNWVKAFTSGDDIHKSTACAIWGEEHYNRDYRKMAKYANFSILYGASSHSLYADSRYGFKSLQEAEDFYNKYKKALPTLFQWQDRLIYSARRKGMLQTFFGRPRRLRSYYENKQIGFANRSAGNTSVQGVAGDILKMVMIKLWRALFNNDEFKNDVAWRVAIHDEIGYTIRATKLMRILKIIKETQSVKLPEWPVEIITDPSVGWSMGRVYDFHMVEDDSELGYHFEPDLA